MSAAAADQRLGRASATLSERACSSAEERRPSKPLVGGSNPPRRIALNKPKPAPSSGFRRLWRRLSLYRPKPPSQTGDDECGDCDHGGGAYEAGRADRL